jgi:plastocyanin
VRRAVLLAVSACALALAIAGVSAASKTNTKTVKVSDDYYAPVKLTVRAGTKVRWVWVDGNYDTHDVRLGKHPKGVKKWGSELAASDFSFSRKLTVPGTYKIYCSIHADMRQTIVVRR